MWKILEKCRRRHQEREMNVRSIKTAGSEDLSSFTKDEPECLIVKTFVVSFSATPDADKRLTSPAFDKQRDDTAIQAADP